MERELIIDAMLKSENLVASILATSQSYVPLHLEASIPNYFTTCSEISKVILKLDLINNGPEGVQGTVFSLSPFVALALPGMAQGFVHHLCDGWLLNQGFSPDQFEEKVKAYSDAGDAGEPNFVHGVLVLDSIGVALGMILGTYMANEMRQSLDLSPIPDIVAGVH